jgi:methylase of polypeptide subunit release factors
VSVRRARGREQAFRERARAAVPDADVSNPAVLLAGADGLDAVRELVAQAPAGTRLALEHAPGQAAAVRQLLDGARTVRDLAGRERVTTGAVP